MDKPAFPSKAFEEVKEANALSPSSGVEALQRGVEELQSEHEATKAHHEQLMACLRYTEQQQYYTRLAQFVLHHFAEMNRQAMIACGKGPDPLLHAECEHGLKKFADRAKGEYIAVFPLKKESWFIRNAIRDESTQPVKAKKLQKRLDALNNRIRDRLEELATEFNFDGKAELFDQAMSIADRYQVNRAENPGELNAFFNTCCAEYHLQKNRDLAAFFQRKYPDA